MRAGSRVQAAVQVAASARSRKTDVRGHGVNTKLPTASLALEVVVAHPGLELGAGALDAAIAAAVSNHLVTCFVGVSHSHYDLCYRLSRKGRQLSAAIGLRGAVCKCAG